MSTQLDLPPSALGKLDRELRGRLITPLDEEYNQARSVWNGSIDKFPALIVRAADEADVAAAITIARRHELPLAVRGGAHNVAGSGTCDNGMVIDLGALNSVRVDEAARLAVAEVARSGAVSMLRPRRTDCIPRVVSSRRPESRGSRSAAALVG
jgi:hypothetical protein